MCPLENLCSVIFHTMKGSLGVIGKVAAMSPGSHGFELCKEPLAEMQCNTAYNRLLWSNPFQDPVHSGSLVHRAAHFNLPYYDFYVKSVVFDFHDCSFPYRRRFDDNVDHSVEASNQLKMDMVHTEDCIESNKKQSSKAEVWSSLRQEVSQGAIQCALEKALERKSFSQNITYLTSMSMPTAELIREIAVLELEVLHLEQYLLSLYRKAFDQQISSLAPRSTQSTQIRRHLEFSKSDVMLRRENSSAQLDSQSVSNPWKETNSMTEDKVKEPGVHQTHSSLTQHSAPSNSAPLSEEIPEKALRACHSQPFSVVEYAQSSISLAEHLGTCISDHVPETPNKLSEDLVRCMCTIYCKLADPPRVNLCLSAPTSSLSSMSAFSLKDQCDTWSPGLRNESSFNVRLDNPFHVEGLKEFSGPYRKMVEVQCIYRDKHKLGDIELLLQNFRSIVSRLDVTDPRRLSHAEKLAFWINIHNALVMHRVFLLLKAAYNVGGHVVSANVIQNSILGCQMSRPGQWLHLLLSSRGKLKVGDERRDYAIEHPEPLLHFALCSGNHSDTAVRVYTPKRVFQELEVAKEEYIRATFGVKKDQKVVLPKVV